MIVRGPEFWGFDLIVSMCVAYAIILALALIVMAIRRAVRGRGRSVIDAATVDPRQRIRPVSNRRVATRR